MSGTVGPALDSIIGKLAVVPVGDTGTISYGMAATLPYGMAATLSMATAARTIDAGCVCQLTALGWTRDI